MLNSVMMLLFQLALVSLVMDGGSEPPGPRPANFKLLILFDLVYYRVYRRQSKRNGRDCLDSSLRSK